MIAIYFKEGPELLATVTAPVAVRPQHTEAARDIGPDGFDMRANVVAGRHDGPAPFRETPLDVTEPRLFARVETIPTLGRGTVPRQLVETRSAPDVRANSEILSQQVRAGDDFAQNRPAAKELNVR